MVGDAYSHSSHSLREAWLFYSRENVFIQLLALQVPLG